MVVNLFALFASKKYPNALPPRPFLPVLVLLMLSALACQLRGVNIGFLNAHVPQFGPTAPRCDAGDPGPSNRKQVLRDQVLPADQLHVERVNAELRVVLDRD